MYIKGVFRLLIECVDLCYWGQERGWIDLVQLINYQLSMLILCMPISFYAQDGDRFWRMPEVYVRGNTVKYLRVPDEVLEKAKENDLRREERRPGRGRGRGRSSGGRGRGRDA